MIFRYIAVAFSLYSRIPMPHFKWKDSDMKYSLIFFPWIGVAIGGLSVLLWQVSMMLGLPEMATILLLALVPVLITGGFHIDGFMDVQDALRSYADKNKKLEIMKDPHIGAFAVIGLIKLLLIYGIGLTILVYANDINLIIVYGIIFVVCRAVSGILARILQKAKRDGMLFEETKASGNVIEISLILQLIIAFAVMFIFNWVMTLFMLLGLVIAVLYYIYKTKKEFDGVTGDTAGFFLCLSETTMLIFLAFGIMIYG